MSYSTDLYASPLVPLFQPQAPMQPVFQDGDAVEITAGSLKGCTGTVVATDNQPGTVAVFIPRFCGGYSHMAYGIPEAHVTLI